MRVVLHAVAPGTPEDWTAFGTVGLLLVAIVAAFYAAQQLAEARRSREEATKDAYDLQEKANKAAYQLHLEQIQPNVVLIMEPGRADVHLFDLVLKNFGQTSAHDVRVSMGDSPLRRTSGDGGPLSEVVRWPEVIPVLAPGQELRIFWDNSVRRLDDPQFPDRHEAQVNYTDTHGRPLESQAILDWGVYRQGLTTTVLGVHSLAKAVTTMATVVASFQEDIHGGVAVYVRDGSAKDAKRIADYEAGRSANSALQAMLTPRSVAERDDTDD